MSGQVENGPRLTQKFKKVESVEHFRRWIMDFKKISFRTLNHIIY